mmetsp:Transcript_8311/g.10894  ORF Transcript_8311/g.10894 Transcript_8311/m.10894 type:complete len:368 (-) Transcript_8311:197-1300(-)|eukprot:CAMPEP_0198144920 /NCGR_PEP_ID=MMETSP1443-20131203/19576_1 /TAXON_ID=186043 /ORGANISM="Entomoneis sp., Strain CCMP2396" /LENGTH=367 /DNA_ID=CAMNT_0043808415 /DNA_START=18 /DNA_END=1121 /DNA_ORIENTATION=+
MSSLSSLTHFAAFGLAISAVCGFTSLPHNHQSHAVPALFYSNGGAAGAAGAAGQDDIKNSDRARIERDLEEAMDNDWRLFRAKLLAQEKYYCIEHSDPKLKQQGRRNRSHEPSSLFAGNLIAKQPKKNNMEVLYNDDPFVSEAELPLLIPKTAIDKHRWAHEIPLIESGSVLVANERLGGIFHQTVVLVIQHHETEGTFGVVINRPQEGGLGRAVVESDSNIGLSLKMAFQKSQVTYGGPILPQDYHVLHSFGAVTGSRKICPGVYIGGSEELISQVRYGEMDPRRAMFVKGHSAWEGGQLQVEIDQGVWYNAAVSADLILRYAGVELQAGDNPNDLWTDILSCMGGMHEDIARRYGGTGDSRRAMP